MLFVLCRAVVWAIKKPRAGYRPGFSCFGRRPVAGAPGYKSGAQAAKPIPVIEGSGHNGADRFAVCRHAVIVAGCVHDEISLSSAFKPSDDACQKQEGEPLSVIGGQYAGPA